MYWGVREENRVGALLREEVGALRVNVGAGPDPALHVPPGQM